MSNFTHRSYLKELLDGTDIPFEDIKRNMEELNIINTRLGGHSITLDGIEELIRGRTKFNEPLNIVELGSGGGDNLKAIYDWAIKINLPVHLTGIDINPECIAFAREKHRGLIDFIHGDFLQVTLTQKPDIIFSSLFCHHFSDQQLVSMLHWMRGKATIGFFINDLHRSPIAYYAIALLTRFFSKSYLVKNDAPLSVKRGFIRNDWKEYFDVAGIRTFKIQWKWAFRWLITCSHGQI
ncbi:MAG: hypothetical protein NVS1B13_09480 [Flavisolibacter sp.]